MKTVVTFENRVYVEENNSKPVIVKTKCKCGNPLVAPLGTLLLGIVTDCSHCSSKNGYPYKQHCRTLIQSYKELIEGETHVGL